MKITLLVPPNRYRHNVARDLIYGCWCKGKRIGGVEFPPIPLVLLATILKKGGHDVIVTDAQFQAVDSHCFKYQFQDKDVVIVLTSTSTIVEDARMLSELKEVNPKLLTIVFGSHPTFMPYAVLKHKGIDFIIRGEPEAVICDLINSFRTGKWKNLQGIGYKEDKEIIVNEEQPLIEDLDCLPIPDRQLLDKGLVYDNPIVKRLPYTTVFTSRGCLGRCTFCTVPAFYKESIRLRSVGSVLEELRQVKALGYKEVFFRDEMFTVSRERTIKICEGLLRDKMGLSWICSTKIGTIDLEMMRLMKKAGCHLIRLGVESGVQRVIDNINKDITIEQTQQTFDWANKIGLGTHAHCMIGLPGETEADVKKTIKFVKKLNPAISTFGICTPLPGTQLFQEVADRCPDIGDGSQCDLSRLHDHSFYNETFSSLTSAQLSYWIRKAYKAFYLDPVYLVRYIKKIGSIGELRRAVRAGLKVIIFSCWPD